MSEHHAARLDVQALLQDERLCLRPLQAEDFAAVYAMAADPAVWAQHPDPERYQEEAFKQRFFQPAVESQSAYVAIDKASARIIGSSRYYDLDAQNRELAIGYTFLGTPYWGSGANLAMKCLMLNHAFTWAKTVWFHIGAQNIRSRKAVEKLGAELARLENRDVNGELQSYAYYCLSDSQWRNSAVSQV